MSYPDYIILSGNKYPGFKQATTLGCPTINIHLDLGGSFLLPGSYIGYISNGPSYRNSLIYVSPYNGHYTKVECHIVDGFTIHDEPEATVKIVKKIRSHISTNSLDELKEIIRLDIEKTKEYFKNC